MENYTVIDFTKYTLTIDEQKMLAKLTEIKADKQKAANDGWFERSASLRDAEKRLAKELYDKIQNLIGQS